MQTTELPEKVKAKIETNIKREIREMVENLVLGTYAGEVYYGGHIWPYEVDLSKVEIDCHNLVTDWK